MKKRILSVLVMLSLILSLATPTLAASASSDKNNEKYGEGIGRVRVSTIPLPSDIILQDATYTYSGKVFVSYKTVNDLNTKDFFNFAILNDDGTKFKTIFSGVIPLKDRTGGIRYMPFQDNKRILLGDYVLECMPNLDKCNSTNLVPIVYPAGLDENNPNLTTRWSEIIIAPDNKHMAWSMFSSNSAGGQAVGVLSRKTDSYVLENVQLISVTEPFVADPNNPGFIIPPAAGRGGEVKQFIHGGNALSVVGAKNNVTTDSVIEDLTSTNVTQITHTPGYDETTIFSPDERLGMVMSTRFSAQTDPAIFGIMPRPIYIAGGINGILYYYSVAGVRTFRSGDIGPALVDINRSMNDPGYKGIQLSTDPDWVYHSPMSWHPDGKHAMWIEGRRGLDDDLHKRLQKVTLLDYKPHKTVPVKVTSDHIPGATTDLTKLNSSSSPNVQGKIAGKHSGYIDYSSSSTSPISGISEAQYVNYSDDGINFYNGSEKYNYNYLGESVYETHLQLTGNQPGEMNLRATFSSILGDTPARLLFDPAADGQPKSYGYATFNGITLHVEDLIE
ncbi:hypothetical protein [Paenibacillus glycanilyticus]|uniref:Uncharacterized protein n=1 Tax=Paenibacillus glycanilyticus TaxID=126569 RepID=A0ABQ6G5R2_9BACL|nr:hypothetical protein [Paenibacillus glycanilyticus]GLX66324.1 hypothetical protein MU1_06680 [Paenibacillus glycanilyticus]